MHIIGGFSPTIASYISLKRNNKVKNLKEWLKKIFDIKHNIWTYVLVILFVLIYYVLGCAINGFEFGAPIFMLIVILPMMLFGGGNEEVGWRMILQPELEKKFGFHIATIFTSIIWWLWHLPIFFIIGTANANMNYFLFGIMCLTLCYALATIRKVSKGVFPCILTHCLINGLSAIFLYKSTRYFPTCSHNFPKAGEARFQGRSRLFRLLGKFPYLGESRRILMAVSSKTSSKTRFYYAATRRISSAAVQPSIWA